jgi:hypothetical protein
MPLEYATEAEADIHGITFGQKIIDGKIPGLLPRKWTRTIGEVREWLNRADVLMLLSGIPDRRFESYPLRHFWNAPGKAYRMSVGSLEQRSKWVFFGMHRDVKSWNP